MLGWGDAQQQQQKQHARRTHDARTTHARRTYDARRGARTHTHTHTHTHTQRATRKIFELPLQRVVRTLPRRDATRRARGASHQGKAALRESASAALALRLAAPGRHTDGAAAAGACHVLLLSPQLRFQRGVCERKEGSVDVFVRLCTRLEERDVELLRQRLAFLRRHILVALCRERRREGWVGERARARYAFSTGEEQHAGGNAARKENPPCRAASSCTARCRADPPSLRRAPCRAPRHRPS